MEYLLPILAILFILVFLIVFGMIAFSDKDSAPKDSPAPSDEEHAEFFCENTGINETTPFVQSTGDANEAPPVVQPQIEQEPQKETMILSDHEKSVIQAYRSDKNMQVAIDRLLCVDSQTPNATQEQTKSKYIKCKIGFLFSASLIYGIIYASVKSSNVTLPTIATALILTVLILSAWYLSDFIAPKPKK